MYLCIVYLSRPTNTWPHKQLDTILTEFRQKNKKANVTGMLLYGNQQIFQVLEGAPEVVKSLLQKIADDDRHKDMEVIFDQLIEDRFFSDWSMAFLPLKQIDVLDLPGYSRILIEPIANVIADDNEVVDLMRMFKKIIQRDAHQHG
ncbi:MAG TPA: BLUF domain-containing protein [Anaerolineae bacterium]|nr:BLUF domain-containing protein [Anaerolineae bacterium]